MMELAQGTTRWLKYEDIVVRAFKLFPDEFALRGYPDFPDSSDIHKPLYGILKRDGMIRAANKTFKLTDRGVEVARRMRTGGGKRVEEQQSGDRMTRDVRREVDRMANAEASQLFKDGEANRILDTDFYAFLGCTVRTSRNDFLGRLKTAEAALDEARRLRQPEPAIAKHLNEVWEFLRGKFGGLIEKRKSGDRKGLSLAADERDSGRL
jgi:hypothetical protein